MEKDTDTLVSSTSLTAPSRELFLNRERPELASKLFAMSVDLEGVLQRKNEQFRTEIRRFVADIQQRRKNISFNARDIMIFVEEEESVSKFYAFLTGLFGHEHKRTRKVSMPAQQLATRDIAVEIDKFITKSLEDFDKKVLGIFDIDATVAEFVKHASDQLYYDEFVILKVAVRRSLAKISVKPWHLRFDPTGPHQILRDASEIAEALESAEVTFDRVCSSIISKANATRKRFEEDIERVLSGLNEELVGACVARKQMEVILQAAMEQNGESKVEALLSPQFLSEASSRVVGPASSDDLHRTLLNPLS